MKELILLRGLPGSGKSTLAQLFGTANHYEADMYFTNAAGEYKFDPTGLRSAHEWCRYLVMVAMGKGEERIVVSNTFTQEWEMQPYFDLAKEYGYQVHSIIVENRHGGVNVHGVPEEKLVQMKDRFEVKL